MKCGLLFSALPLFFSPLHVLGLVCEDFYKFQSAEISAS